MFSNNISFLFCFVLFCSVFVVAAVVFLCVVLVVLELAVDQTGLATSPHQRKQNETKNKD